MKEKQIKARVQHKVDTWENWGKAENFIPLKGELIIYTTDENGNAKTQFKIGDGESYVRDLKFAFSDLTSGESGTTAIQSDWTQTDSLSADYIKNKPGDEYNTKKIIFLTDSIIVPEASTNTLPGFYASQIFYETDKKLQNGDMITFTTLLDNISLSSQLIVDEALDEAFGMASYQTGYFATFNTLENILEAVQAGLPKTDENIPYSFGIVLVYEGDNDYSLVIVSPRNDLSHREVKIEISRAETGYIKLSNNALNIDLEPTENSNNLITSGVVHNIFKNQSKVTSVHGKIGDVILTAADIKALPETTIIPTKLSQLENDKGYLDKHQNLDNYPTRGELVEELNKKENILIWDETPTENSMNPVYSKGIYSALNSAVGYIENIANGKCKSYVFDYRFITDENYINDPDKNSKTVLKNWLENFENTQDLNTGDIFLIRDIGVPDYWWDAHTETIQILETTKVTLSEYYTKTETNTQLSNLETSINNKLNKKQDLKTISYQRGAGNEIWYFPLATLDADTSNNYGNITLTGRFGGWENNNSATFNIMLMNRSGKKDGYTITSTVSATGETSAALSLCDIVVSRNEDTSSTVYLKCTKYFLFNFDYSTFQFPIIYNGTYTTEEPSNIIWKLSEAPKTITSVNGSFSATGGISADRVNGFKLQTSEGVPPTIDDRTIITFIY